MRLIYVFAVSVFIGTGSVGLAQSATSNAVVTAGSTIMRTAAEQAAGKVLTDRQIEIIKDVLGTTTATGSDDANETSSDDNKDDNTGSSGSKKKDKGKQAGKNSKGKNKGKKKGLPPGLAKKEQLAPGLQKQLERNGTLPPGLAKRGLPDELDERLGEPAEGTERVIVDRDVVLIEKGTGLILDILKDVLKPKQ